METTIANIFGKENDYKLCNNCGKINWYENEKCINCNHSDFQENGEGIWDYVQADYDYYMREEGYTEEEVDNVLVDI